MSVSPGTCLGGCEDNAVIRQAERGRPGIGLDGVAQVIMRKA